jgi:dienelactone hydrolase
MRWAAIACSAVAAAAALAGPVTGAPTGAIRVRILRLVDHSRIAHFRNGATTPRVLLTYVRYPTGARRPLPLVVFAHGFALTPSTYANLLDAWARAGYIVAAPAFPIERAGAPGGPSEADLVNEPGDLRFVVSRLTGQTSALRGLIDPTRVAVAGQSDGAEAALSAAYDPRFRDRRIDAAVILSGAALPGFTAAPPGSPPLLAVQGTSDPINQPGVTAAYYRLMRRPKFLLWLIGASHLPPYTTEDRWAAVVDRATIAFLDRYLRGDRPRPLIAAGTRPGLARLISQP